MLRNAINAAISAEVGRGNFQKAKELRDMLEEIERDTPEVLEMDVGFAYNVKVIEKEES